MYLSRPFQKWEKFSEYEQTHCLHFSVLNMMLSIARFRYCGRAAGQWSGPSLFSPVRTDAFQVAHQHCQCICSANLVMLDEQSAYWLSQRSLAPLPSPRVDTHLVSAGCSFSYLKKKKKKRRGIKSWPFFSPPPRYTLLVSSLSPHLCDSFWNLKNVA